MAYQYCNSYACSGGTEITIPLRVSIGNQYSNINGYVGNCYVQTGDRAMTIEYNWAGGGAYPFDVHMRLGWTFTQKYTGYPDSTYNYYSVYTIPAGTRLKTFFIEVFRRSECPCQESDGPIDNII